MLGATWREIDIEAKVWTIPAERMKAGREHRVPLSAAALAVLEALPSNREPDAFVFPGRPARGGRSRKLDVDTVRVKTLHALTEGKPDWRDAESGEAPDLHGFRSSFREWAQATGVRFEVAEAALAHTERSAVVRAYARSDLLEQRAPVMQDWADFLAGRA